MRSHALFMALLSFVDSTPRAYRIAPANVEIGGAALLALSPTGMAKVWDAVSVSFDRFCRTAGIEAFGTMMEKDAEEACG
jgi:hypothetical protein